MKQRQRITLEDRFHDLLIVFAAVCYAQGRIDHIENPHEKVDMAEKVEMLTKTMAESDENYSVLLRRLRDLDKLIGRNIPDRNWG